MSGRVHKDRQAACDGGRMDAWRVTLPAVVTLPLESTAKTCARLVRLAPDKPCRMVPPVSVKNWPATPVVSVQLPKVVQVWLEPAVPTLADAPITP